MTGSPRAAAGDRPDPWSPAVHNPGVPAESRSSAAGIPALPDLPGGARPPALPGAETLASPAAPGDASLDGAAVELAPAIPGERPPVRESPGRPSPHFGECGETASPSPLPTPGGGLAQTFSVPADPASGTETREEDPGTVRQPAGIPPAEDPPLAVPDETAPSGPAAGGGSSGQEWRNRVKAATSALHAEQRAKRGRYSRKSAGQRFGPGMARRMPPGGAA